MADDYESFKKQILTLTKIDLNAYKEGQMKRRIDTLIGKQKCKGYSEYVNLIKTNHDKFEEFVNYLTINVSEFWRNPEQWKILEEKVVKDLVKKPSFKIWSAACSTGDEPYSLVMLLSKYVPMNRIKIIATDIDKQVLEKAQAGLYNSKSLKGLPDEFKKKYFDQVGDSNFKIKDEVKKCVDFKIHNLLLDPYPSGCDLIVCRNVLIYFTEDAKDAIYVKFHDALKPDGILFLGSTEQIIAPGKIGFSTISSFFYRKGEKPAK
ncbi:MAG: protein-glutamate O-methyltransferase CheR [Lachnospiraceae bacterium]|nr:protein-glutamate O-methyltransferase CheR [Lachnospiraceae bacterium]